MPKVTTTPTIEKARAESSPLSAAAKAKSLRRNHACHQCRKRKMKCDARRPICATCDRSHKHLQAHPPPGVDVPDEVDCTWDELPDPMDSPKHKIAFLETRVQELEALLSGKNINVPSENSHSPGEDSATTLVSEPGDIAMGDADSINDGPDEIPVIDLDLGTSMYWTTWPSELPAPETVQLLVEAFFRYYPHADRLFHRSTFIYWLSLPPTHDQFPSAAILHAICGLGIMYTRQPVSEPTSSALNLDDGASEKHIELAKSLADKNITRCTQLVQSQQALLIVGWWYWCHAKWIEVYMLSSQVLRACPPLDLSRATMFQPITTGTMAPSLIAPPADAQEEETRRNVFWLAYALERLTGCGNGWPLSLDDKDVTQLLPVDAMTFALGMSWPEPQERDHPFKKDVLLTHHTEYTHPFALFVKGNLLLSRVKSYNMRYAQLLYADDPSLHLSEDTARHFTCLQPPTRPGYCPASDARRNNAFVELDQIAFKFIPSFPAHLQTPIVGGAIDVHLYLAHLMPYIALIQMHDPHAHMTSMTCLSSQRLLHSSRGILKLLCDAQSVPGHDTVLLDCFIFFAWFMAGRTLTRFWQVASQVKSEEQMGILKAETQHIASALHSFGPRIPLAGRYAIMLRDHFERMSGQVLQL
ncbi:hypothetical protein PENSPDRAFT_89785 [Peniophora sp. CONT]|nr:hypothetical protein PENSPDRAFT_89785 [Peniophora sp. CONT]